MTKVAIIGAGDLGGAVAQALAMRGRIGRVLLVDAAADVAAGKALDIQQACAVEESPTTVAGSSDVTTAIGFDVCVFADRADAGSEWEGDDGLATLNRVAPYLSGAPIGVAGARPVDLIRRATREAAIAAGRLIGTASEAFASAVRAIVAVEARCSPREVMLAVVGLPPFVVAWSEASIGGYALDRVLAPVQLARLEARAPRLWPPGPHTLGVAAARAVEAALTRGRERVCALTVGDRNRIAAFPVLLNERGIVDVRTPTLNTREQVLLETSLGGG